MQISSAPVLLTVTDSLATIILNRPEKNNAFNAEIIALCIQYLTEIKLKSAIKLVILRSAGKNFSSGADLDWMCRAAQLAKEDNSADASKLSQMLELFNCLPQPTIGVVNGAVYGGAIGLVACCDLVLANPNTKFCFPEVKLGLAPAIISPFVVAVIGLKAARKLMLTAEVFDCQYALKIGLIDEVIAADNLELKLAELSSMLLYNSSVAMHATKDLLIKTNFNYSQQIKTQTINLIAELRTTADAQQRLSQFIERKKSSE